MQKEVSRLPDDTNSVVKFTTEFRNCAYKQFKRSVIHWNRFLLSSLWITF